MAGRRWTPTELMTLRTRYATQPAERIARRLGRSLRSVRHKAMRMGLQKWQHLSDEEERFLEDALDSRLSHDEIADELGRTRSGVKAQMQRRGLVRRRNRHRHRWTPEEVRYLEDHYSKQPVADTAAALGLRPRQVTAKAFKLGLRRRGRVLSEEAEALLFELRDQPGIVEFFAQEFRVSEAVIRRTLAQQSPRATGVLQ